MAISIKEAMTLEYVEEFKLIAGESGLGHTITTVGILDHEILEDMMDIFVEGEFVLATLSIARDDVSLVFKAVKALVDQKAAGLAFKTVYYDTLPKEVLDFANEHKFPIFTIHPDIYLENIINTVFNSIKSRSYHDNMESKLETLFSGIMNPYTIRKLALELNPHFLENISLIYCQENRFISSDNTIRYVEKYNRLKDKSIYHSLFKFRNGVLIILSYGSKPNLQLDLDYIMDILGMTKKDYTLGISRLSASLETMDQRIKESYYAFQAAQLKRTALEYFENIGLYQFLIPHIDDPWAKNFSNQLIEPVIAYDDKYNTKLMETLIIFFDNQCNAKETALALFQHKNTVLYRIRKVKEILGPFESEQSFMEQMSIALKLYTASF